MNLQLSLYAMLYLKHSVSWKPRWTKKHMQGQPHPSISWQDFKRIQ